MRFEHDHHQAMAPVAGECFFDSITLPDSGVRRHTEALALMTDVSDLTAAKLAQAIGEVAPDAAEGAHQLVRLKLLCLEAHTAGILSQEELFSLFTLAEGRQLTGP